MASIPSDNKHLCASENFENGSSGFVVCSVVVLLLVFLSVSFLLFCLCLRMKSCRSFSMFKFDGILKSVSVDVDADVDATVDWDLALWSLLLLLLLVELDLDKHCGGPMLLFVSSRV